MTLILTPQRLTANRKNSLLGGQALKEKLTCAYNLNQSYCKQCNNVLSFSKKKNQFCNQSCSAIFNNTGREKVKGYKCLHCDTIIKTRKYCSIKCSSEAKRKYKTPEEAGRARRNAVREVSANYRAKLRNQTPIDADRKAIKEFYKNCPEGYEVDHIIAISKGGLHTLSNLQYLTITENRKKGNR
jgi:hypothetical protein